MPVEYEYRYREQVYDKEFIITPFSLKNGTVKKVVIAPLKFNSF